MRLRQSALAGLLCGAMLAAHAETPAPPLVSNERQGYAFEFSRVLAEQRLFGIAHGVSLLATACLDSPAEADAAAEAYTRWYEQQQIQIDMLKDELAEFYFGAHAAEASWSHIAEALKLRTALGLAPDSEKLQAACASFPEALRQPRYDLGALFQLEAALAGMTVAARAESYSAACAARLPEAQRPALNARYAEWQQREAEALANAEAQMRVYWQSTATPGKVEDWLKATKKRYATPSDFACAELPTWLGSRSSSLAQSFAPAPPTAPAAAAAESAPDNTVSAVSNAQPEAAPVVAAVPAESAEAPPHPPEAAPANLFDFVMRLFDERPYEDAASQSGK